MAVSNALAHESYLKLRAMARRCMRRSRRGPLLQTTVLAHEAWIRLRRYSDSGEGDPIIAATVLRSVLVDAARREGAVKRGSGWRRVPLDPVAAAGPGAPTVPEAGGQGVDLLDLDEALQGLEESNPRAARIVELRFFGGLSVAETGALLGLCERTIEAEFRLARALLRVRLEPA
jgi:RNA polymerase sigma-70 factor, ECF subfamily